MPTADVISEKAVDAAKSTARSISVVAVLILAVVMAGATASAFVAIRSDSDSSSDVLQDPLPFTPSDDETIDAGDEEPATQAPAGTTYSLTGKGIRAFLAQYRERFQTSQVVDLTMYGDYVVVNVPVPGKARHEGWLYREGAGFTSFGGVTANFPGAQPVDTEQIAIPALLRNLALARASLNVEDPDTTYVIVRQYTSADAVPSVDIHVSNQFGESGYLATRLDGTVERAFPFAP